MNLNRMKFIVWIPAEGMEEVVIGWGEARRQLLWYWYGMCLCES